MFESTVVSLIRRNEPTDELLLLLEDPFQASLQQGSIIAGLGTSVGFTLLLAVGFSLLRPYNSLVYAPKLKIADERHAPPPMGKGVLAWVGPVLKTKEAELVGLIGLDATVFLRVLRMCRNMFLVLMVLGCGILIPINLAKGNKFKDATPIQKMTPVNTFGSANWGMVICAYLFNLVIGGFLWWNYRAILRLRRQYYDSPEYKSSLHARTLMINYIPKTHRSDEGIGRLIDEVAPTSSFSRTAIARNVKELPELIEQHNKTVRELERHLAKYLKNPESLPPKRPLCKPSKKDPSWGTYPKGQKVDAIEYLTGRIKELETEIKEVRATIDSRNPLPYGFASYEEIEEAHSIAFAAKKKQPQGTRILLAPRPSDIIWKNMPLSKSQKRRRRMINNLWITLLTLVWAAPNAMISIFLVNLTNLGRVWKAFNNSLQANKTWWAIVQGVASPAITSLVYLVLPIIFRRLAVKAGDTSKTARERHVTAKLYTFFVFNFLIVFSLFSSVWSFVTTVIEKTNDKTDAWDAIVDANFGAGLFRSLCGISPFWITWLLQRNLGAAVDLAQLWTLVWSFCIRKFSSPTPREMIELTAPPPFDYASYYNYFLFYTTVALCYGTIQPLVLPACAVYFVLDVYLKKYLLLYIFITKTESGGMFWRMFFNRMVFAAILSNLVVFLCVWSQGLGEHTQAYAVIPAPFLMIAFKIWCKKTFDDKMHFVTTRQVSTDLEAVQDKGFNPKKDKLASRFGHPVLYRPLITPMVHARAQNKLAAVYGGRLTDSNNAGSGDSATVSGYSDMYAMDNMLGGQPGRKERAVPGFEMVPENRLDFAYFKGRAEFAEEHGGGGVIYGKAEDIIRSDTPSSISAYGSDSRPGTPVGGMTGRQRPQQRFEGFALQPVSYDAPGDVHLASSNRGMYHQPNDSQNALINSAAEMPVGTPMGGIGSRETSPDRRPPGFLGGGPQGYGGLPQIPLDEPEQDPLSYDYFRAQRRTNTGGPGMGYRG
ncbi:hypothetical protein GLAREA_11475 [Glarea lozoyensis ATCC 20868]|uniref:DUF221-domain-containing protein n=1 Tax=Glarea lozoyensis (strain ATCC 20868 / MF5171) TaxID=1116229 RepID=S3CI04_GLAL2|nr:uncharacterized protein GLAREA_11475 [Glarea lozoyensis ATCC 20868]EPE24894.1 hypothetical protein GLAREA_11475 [Glarea lozoyensis ATCC 20868]